MAEFTYNPVQEVAAGESVILNTRIGCPKGYVLHREESGIVTLRGEVNNPCATFARYFCLFEANIAVPEGGTPGEISVSFAISGEAVPTSLAAVTPTVSEAYFNVNSPIYIDVPAGCCYNISVDNTSGDPINVRNANLIITRTA